MDFICIFYRDHKITYGTIDGSADMYLKTIPTLQKSNKC